MDDETRQPRTEDDYMQMIMMAIGANTPMDAYQWVEARKNVAMPLVFADKTGAVHLARGVKVGTWLSVANSINHMVDEAVA